MKRTGKRSLKETLSAPEALTEELTPPRAEHLHRKPFPLE